MPAIKEVAKQSGVSTATVSRVINNLPGAATAATRARVLQTMRRMNYRPSAVARGLSNKRMNTLGVVMVSSSEFILAGESYYARIIDGILGMNKRCGQKTLLFFDNDWEESYRSLPSYCDGQCDGIVLLGPMVPDDFFESLRLRRVPFVTTGGVAAKNPFSSAAMDDEHAARMVTEYLIGLGHVRIAHLSGEDVRISAQLRLQGFQQAMASANLSESESVVGPGTYDFQSGYERTKALLKQSASARPTALLCADDPIALGALRALQDSDVRVPEQMSVVGINDALEDIWTKPALTSFAQPYHEIGHSLVEMLLAQIDEHLEGGSHKKIIGQLVIRESAGPPPT